jgi:hypothetical protein
MIAIITVNHSFTIVSCHLFEFKLIRILVIHNGHHRGFLSSAVQLLRKLRTLVNLLISQLLTMWKILLWYFYFGGV